MGEVARASTALTRKEANRIILELIKRYEKDLHSPPPPKKFRDCYDWDRVVPKPDWFELYLQTKTELADIGLKV
jgi:hypothetical protein